MCCALHNIRIKFNEIEQDDRNNFFNEQEDEEIEIMEEDENQVGAIVRNNIVEMYFNHDWLFNLTFVSLKKGREKNC